MWHFRRSEVPSGSVCDYDDYFYDGDYDDTPDYFDDDDPGGFDNYPSMFGVVGPDNYELHHDLHGPHDCGVYCVSCGGVCVVPYWSGDDDGDMHEGDVALPRAGSDKPVDGSGYSVISTSGPGGSGQKEEDVCKGDVALPRFPRAGQ